MTGYIALGYWDLAIASVLVLIDAALSIIFGLRIHRSLVVAAIRMTVQLALVGLVLTFLFAVVSPLWTGLAALGMILFAGLEITQRQERRLSGWWAYGLGTGCMMIASVLVTVFALLTALRPTPWYDPRYAIPLLGMILGNCMTGIALGLHTLTTSLVSRRASVEAQLMLGATRWDAAAPVTREALRSALMPTVNSMSATGLVSLPGMMTGQILGGVPPIEAVKYQIGDVPDCGGYRYWSRSSCSWRRFPPDRRTSPAASRSPNRCEAFLAQSLKPALSGERMQESAVLNLPPVEAPIEHHEASALGG